MTEIHDVAIVGCGPVGATLANLLERQGRRVVVVDQFAEPYPLPRATHIDGEALRILQTAGVADALSPRLGVYTRMRTYGDGQCTIMQTSHAFLPRGLHAVLALGLFFW